jgi:hypothetical protein
MLLFITNTINTTTTRKDGASTYNTGKYEERVRNISDKFGQIAHQLDSVARDIQNRIQITSSSLSTVESTWVPPLTNFNKATTVAQKSNKVTTSTSSASGPLKALASHLKTA